MSDVLSPVRQRLSQVQSIIASNKTATEIPFDPDSTSFPSRKDVPRRRDAPEGAAWVWGEDDNVGCYSLVHVLLLISIDSSAGLTS